ncbi:MAG: hypothetical protein A4E60_02481 [Syntrophorhabdus sp. PtaB.Bin047]|jgi:hypothetical protein|nr:MAG: hypothetical protein A4E60_02481 [Syntrophorhabdus sp. PtaB.Bin047]
MFERCFASLRSTVDCLRSMRKLLETEVEVNPEQTADVQSHFDGPIPVLFNKVQAYPNARLFTNLYSAGNLIIGPFCLRGCESAPCQETVTKPHQVRHGQNAARRQHPCHGNVVPGKYACHSQLDAFPRT